MAGGRCDELRNWTQMLCVLDFFELELFTMPYEIYKLCGHPSSCYPAGAFHMQSLPLYMVSAPSSFFLFIRPLTSSILAQSQFLSNRPGFGLLFDSLVASLALLVRLERLQEHACIEKAI